MTAKHPKPAPTAPPIAVFQVSRWAEGPASIRAPKQDTSVFITKKMGSTENMAKLIIKRGPAPDPRAEKAWGHIPNLRASFSPKKEPRKAETAQIKAKVMEF